jgi:hypothetical protein
MVNQSTGDVGLIDRRSVLRAGAALAAAGSALLHGAPAEAQPRPSGASSITIIDAQVHAYAANTPERPWHSVPNWPPHVTGDEMVAAMDKVGVDGAIYISPVSIYQYDASYAVEVQKAILTSLRSLSRSTPTIRRWPMSLPIGRRHLARLASASS